MPQSFCFRLRRARLLHGHSQATLAQACGLHVETIGQWERGRRRPPASKLQLLARILGVTPAWLLGGEIAPTVMPMLACDQAFASFLDTRIADLQQQIAVIRAVREALA